MIFLLLSSHKNFKTLEWPREFPFYNEKLAKILSKKGITFMRSSSYEFDKKSQLFFRAEIVKSWWWEEVKNIQPDKILCYSNTVNQDLFDISKIFSFQNNLDLVQLANNKLQTSIFFSNFSPKTYTQIPINTLTDKKYVIKPIDGTGWNDISCIYGKELLDLCLKENYIMQEYIDSSIGVPWIVKGIHDMRFIVFGEKIFSWIYIRTPKKWDFKCNLCQWGNWFYMPITNIPKDIMGIVDKIKASIYQNYREWYYSIDISNTVEWPILMELNSSTWFCLDSENQHHVNDLFLEKLADFIISI